MEFLLDAVDRFPLLEEFTDSVEQPDPVPLVLMRASQAACGETVNAKDASGCGQQVGGEEAIGRDVELAAVRTHLRRGRRSPLTE